MMLENWSFRRDNLAVLNMIRVGLLGEIVHCHCAHSHDCIDHWFFDPQGNMTWGGEFLVKGLDRVLDFLAAARGLKPWLWVLGNDHLAHWKQEAERRGVADRVRWPEFLADTASFYQACDLLLLPSRYDAFGLPALEAMACGCPVLVSDQAGGAELVEHGKEGLVVPGNAPVASWLPPISALLTDRARWQECSGHAVRKAVTHTWEQVAAETEKVYAQVLSSRPRNGA